MYICICPSIYLCLYRYLYLYTDTSSFSVEAYTTRDAAGERTLRRGVASHWLIYIFISYYLLYINTPSFQCSVEAYATRNAAGERTLRRGVASHWLERLAAPFLLAGAGDANKTPSTGGAANRTAGAAVNGKEVRRYF